MAPKYGFVVFKPAPPVPAYSSDYLWDSPEDALAAAKDLADNPPADVPFDAEGSMLFVVANDGSKVKQPA